MIFLYKQAYTGVHFAKHPSERRSILLSNVISLVLFGLGTFLFTVYFLYFGWSVVTGAIFVITFLSLFTLWLNANNHSVVSRIWLCFLIPVSTMLLSLYSKTIYYHRQEELDYFTFRIVILSSCVFPGLFFSFKERYSLIVTTVLILIILMLHDPLHNYWGVPYRAGVLKKSSYAFTNVVVLITYCILSAGVIFLKWLSERNEEKADKLIQELNQINEELVKKNSEIEMQNLEISAQSENINRNQQKLQEAYRLIEEQKNLLIQQNQNLSTELLEKNKDLTETNSELIKHNNELRQFSYTVSHNLRGPVASLLGLISLVNIKNLSQQDAEVFGHLNRSAEQLDTIIKDLNKIIDIRHDIFQVRQRINLAQEMQDVMRLLKRDIETHDVTFDLNFAHDHTIYSVKPMIHSIFYNLTSNAIKYRSAQRKPHIKITAQENENHYILNFTDNGLGIDLARYKDSLFKLYKRFHYHTEGKGIGLYLVKLQTEALGGSIRVQSEINRYTAFTLYLPKPQNIERQLLYRDEHTEIFFDAKINSIGTLWQGPITSDQYRKTFKNCLSFVIAYNTPNYIADISQQGPIDKQDQHWMFTEIMPDAARNGLTRIATVRPDAADDHIQAYLKDINENLNKVGIHQRYFLSMEEAVAWIQDENEKATLNVRA